MTARPATAKDMAESPSVRISVQSSECLVPALLASFNLGKPAMLNLSPTDLQVEFHKNSKAGYGGYIQHVSPGKQVAPLGHTGPILQQVQIV